MSTKRILWPILVIAAMAFYPRSGICAVPVTVGLQPREVTVGALFNGARVSVSGTIPAGSEAVVTVTGRRDDLTLKTKGRVFGLLWMNLGSVTFHQVPRLYLVNVTKEIKEFALLNPVEWQRLGVGLDWLKGQVEITPDSVDIDTSFAEFLKLKESEGLYAVRDGTVRYGTTENGMTSFESDVYLPSRVHPGDYEVKVLALKEGRIEANATQYITVEEVGVPALLASLAFDHGALYGVLAVLIAIVGGLLMDFFFGEQKGAH